MTRTVTITITGEVAVPSTVEIRDADTGEPIKGLRAATINVRVGERITADLEIVSAETGNRFSTYAGETKVTRAAPVFLCADPHDGKLKVVSVIQFADGSKFEAAGV